MAETIHCARGGAAGGKLLLLHGLGASGAVWDGLLPVLAERWPGSWLVPDLRGHGRSFHRAPYGFGIHAADVAALLEQDEEVSILGHSMGGVVGMALATGLFGVKVKSVVVFGVKVEWSEADVQRAHTVAQAPAKLFATREEALERYLRVSGLKGLVSADSAIAASGVSECQGNFRLAADPLTNALGTPDFVRLAQASQAALHLFCGELDAVTSAQAMRCLGAEVKVLAGLGHNAHVEAPRVVWDAVAAFLAN